MKGLQYEPATDGFVFSIAEIHAAIDKDRHLNRAIKPISAVTDPKNSKRRQPEGFYSCEFEFICGPIRV